MYASQVFSSWKVLNRWEKIGKTAKEANLGIEGWANSDHFLWQTFFYT